MTIEFNGDFRRPIIDLDEPLTWDACRRLVRIVDTLIDRFFFDEVEIAIASPGGRVDALSFYLRAADRWRSRGLRLRTHAISNAESGAALMLSLGTERAAEPEARLLYHLARYVKVSSVTAQVGAQMLDSLNAIDGEMVRRLADRALETRRSCGSVPYRAQPSDRDVLEHLVRGSGEVKGGREKLRDLARALGRTVTRAIRQQNRDALVGLYSRLAATDVSISPELALTLRLIDRVGAFEEGATRTRGPAGLVVPEWSALFPPGGDVPRDVLTRHCLILGETGSGKTASAILPIVAAMAKAPSKRLSCALIIDPKKELAPILKTLAPDRVHHLTTSDCALDLMVGRRWSMAEDLAAGRWLSAATKMLFRVVSFIPSSPARAVLMGGPSKGSTADFFDRNGTTMVLDVLALALMLTAPNAPDPREWGSDDRQAVAWVTELIARAQGDGTERGPNALALCAWAIEGPLVLPQSEETTGTVYLDGCEDGWTPKSRVWLFGRIAQLAMPIWGSERGEGQDVLKRVIQYWTPLSAIERQHAGIVGTARAITHEFASPAIARSLYFGCEPGYVAALAAGLCLDVNRTVAPGQDNVELVLFQPSRDGLDNLIAVALKALFFEAVLEDSDREGGAADLPLVGYVADEAHRFITADRVHGEQSFLDSCRSYGACCFLACQSISSIEHTLADGGGSPALNDAAVSILWNNTGSKLVFRTTDRETTSRVQDLCPRIPGQYDVTEVRPVSTLRPGEAYVALADGRFERRQLRQFDVGELKKVVSDDRGLDLRALSFANAPKRRLPDVDRGDQPRLGECTTTVR